MARTVKSPEVRRNEILDKAQELFYSKGYEQASIQEIIDGVGIAKGTFYHYFSSKSELLDELIERILQHNVHLVAPIVDDENLNALEKFHRFFRTIENWKIENRVFLKRLLLVYYNDDNVLLRHKLLASSIAQFAPSLGKIVSQGIAEGFFNTRYPEEIGASTLEISYSLGERLAVLLLENKADEETLLWVKHQIVVTQYAMECLLGASEGAIQIFDFDRIKLWFEPLDVDLQLAGVDKVHTDLLLPG